MMTPSLNPWNAALAIDIQWCSKTGTDTGRAIVHSLSSLRQKEWDWVIKAAAGREIKDALHVDCTVGSRLGNTESTLP